MNLKEEKIASKNVFTGRMLHVQVDDVRLPDGREATRELVRHPGAAAVVPILPDGRIVLVRQFRYPLGRETLEIPAGKLEPGEDPQECILRELQEEAGYKAGSIKHLSTICTAPGFTDEVIHLYEASQLQPSQLQPDDDEFLQVQVFTLEEIRQMIHSGEIEDAKTIVSLLLHGANGGSL
jgi:ADP-ribose pyrophosphatase